METGTFDRPESVEKKGKTNENENKINSTPSKKIKKENALNIWREYKRRGSFKNSNVATVHPIHSWNSVDSPS